MTTPTSTEQYLTRGGITVRRTIESVPVRNAVEPLLEALDERAGRSSSSYEYPGRYTRWDIGFVDPPLVLTARGRAFRVDALNERGRVLLRRSRPPLPGSTPSSGSTRGTARSTGKVRAPAGASRRRSAAASPRSSRCSGRWWTCSSARTSRPRPVRRLRLRPGLPVRAAAAPPRAPGRPARPGPLPARRDPRRRPPAQRGRAAPLRDRGRGRDHRRPAARRRPALRRRRPRGRAPATTARRVRRAGRDAQRVLPRGDLFEVVPGQMFTEPRPARPPSCSRRLEPTPRPTASSSTWAGRVPGGRLARDVRARRRRPGGDLPDLRHDRARQRPIGGRRPDPGAAQLGEGRVRADDVHRRRPQRQVARLRARARSR